MADRRVSEPSDGGAEGGSQSVHDRALDEDPGPYEGLTPVLTRVPPPRGPSRRAMAVVLAVAGVVVVVAAAGLLQGSRPPTEAITESSIPAVTDPIFASPAAPRISFAQLPSIPGSIAYVTSGAVAVVDSTGTTHEIAEDAGVSFGFPAWSPDGTRIAVVGSDSSYSSISVFDVKQVRGGSSERQGPRVIYRSSTTPPFYLYWAPDGKTVSFLASEPEPTDLTLRLASIDGSPLDPGGNAPSIRRGNPLYFDWADPSHLLLHVGTGPRAFLGEVGRDGKSTGARYADPGDFRSAAVSPDGRRVAYVQATTTGRSELVVGSRTGSRTRAVPAFGPTAFVFDPSGTTLATIGADRPGGSDIGFPAGPLRLLDTASGKARVLADGFVLAFFWSPDGRTVALLRLEPRTGPTAAVDGPVGGGPPSDIARLVRYDMWAAVAATTEPSPSTAPATDVHLLFVDVATGTTRSDRIVQLPSPFVDQYLSYFDQYALSHRLWAPDGSALLMPLDEDGSTRVAAFSPNGGDPLFTIDGRMAFWSP